MSVACVAGRASVLELSFIHASFLSVVSPSVAPTHIRPSPLQLHASPDCSGHSAALALCRHWIDPMRFCSTRRAVVLRWLAACALCCVLHAHLTTSSTAQNIYTFTGSGSPPCLILANADIKWPSGVSKPISCYVPQSALSGQRPFLRFDGSQGFGAYDEFQITIVDPNGQQVWTTVGQPLGPNWDQKTLRTVQLPSIPVIAQAGLWTIMMICLNVNNNCDNKPYACSGSSSLPSMTQCGPAGKALFLEIPGQNKQQLSRQAVLDRRFARS